MKLSNKCSFFRGRATSAARIAVAITRALTPLAVPNSTTSPSIKELYAYWSPRLNVVATSRPCSARISDSEGGIVFWAKISRALERVFGSPRSAPKENVRAAALCPMIVITNFFNCLYPASPNIRRVANFTFDIMFIAACRRLDGDSMWRTLRAMAMGGSSIPYRA